MANDIPPIWLKEYAEPKSTNFRSVLNMDWLFDTGRQVFVKDGWVKGDDELIALGTEERWVGEDKLLNYTGAIGELADALEFRRRLSSLEWQIHDGKVVLPADTLEKSTIFNTDSPLEAAHKYGFVSQTRQGDITDLPSDLRYIVAEDIFAVKMKQFLQGHSLSENAPLRKEERQHQELIRLVGNYLSEDGCVVTDGTSRIGLSLQIITPIEKLHNFEFLKKLSACYGITVGDDKFGKPIARIPFDLLKKHDKIFKWKTGPKEFGEDKHLQRTVSEKAEKTADGSERHIETLKGRGLIDIPLDGEGMVLEAVLNKLRISIPDRYREMENDTWSVNLLSSLVDNDFVAKNKHFEAIGTLQTWGKAGSLQAIT